MEPNGDSVAYLALADGLKRGCGFASWTGNHCAAPETNRTPGYPAFLWLMPGVRAALISQAFLWSMLCFFTGLFTAEMAGAAAGYCAAGIIAADVPSIVSSNQVMSETLFTALLTGAVLAQLEILRSPGSSVKRYSLLALASAMLGLALIVRPIAEFIIPLAIAGPVLGIGIRRVKKASMALVIAAGPVLCGTAWIFRNHLVAGTNVLSTIGGLNLFYYRAVGTLAVASHTAWSEALGRTQRSPNQSLAIEGLRIIIHHPFAFTAMTIWSLLYVSWVPDRAPLAHFLGVIPNTHTSDPGSIRIEALARQLWTGHFAGFGALCANELHSSTVLTLLVAFQLMMMGFVWAGAILAFKRYRRRSPPARCILFALAVAFLILLPASGPEATARFRTPAIPLLALLAGVGWFDDKDYEPVHP
jgi:hypothetical protein